MDHTQVILAFVFCIPPIRGDGRTNTAIALEHKIDRRYVGEIKRRITWGWLG